MPRSHMVPRVATEAKGRDKEASRSVKHVAKGGTSRDANTAAEGCNYGARGKSRRRNNTALKKKQQQPNGNMQLRSRNAEVTGGDKLSTR